MKLVLDRSTPCLISVCFSVRFACAAGLCSRSFVSWAPAAALSVASTFSNSTSFFLKAPIVSLKPPSFAATSLLNPPSDIAASTKAGPATFQASLNHALAPPVLDNVCLPFPVFLFIASFSVCFNAATTTPICSSFPSLLSHNLKASLAFAAVASFRLPNVLAFFASAFFCTAVLKANSSSRVSAPTGFVGSYLPTASSSLSAV